VSGAEDRLKEAEQLLDRLEKTRTKLEETKDPDEAIQVLSELAEIAKKVEDQLRQARREAEALARRTSCESWSRRTWTSWR
jgi:glutamine synthetase type III